MKKLCLQIPDRFFEFSEYSFINLKSPTTIYIDPEVPEFLTLRSAKGAGSVSQQLEELARKLIPLEKEQKTLERKHAQGYEKHPVKSGEFDDFYSEQNLENV